MSDLLQPQKSNLYKREFLHRKGASLLISVAEFLDILLNKDNLMIHLKEVGLAARPVILPKEIVLLKPPCRRGSDGAQ